MMKRKNDELDYPVKDVWARRAVLVLGVVVVLQAALIGALVVQSRLSAGDSMPAIAIPSPVSMVYQAFTVQSAMEWQKTGVSVQPGDRLTVEYVSGQWRSFAPTGMYGPDGGSSYVCKGADCVEPLPGYAQGGLIARIDDSAPFAVGSLLKMLVKSPGTLWLRMNDAGIQDNIGSVTMQITVTQGP